MRESATCSPVGPARRGSDACYGAARPKTTRPAARTAASRRRGRWSSSRSRERGATTGDRAIVIALSRTMRRVLVVSATLAIGAMLVGPLACRQIVGIGSSPETDLTTTVCGLPYGTNTCASCAQANCCAESNVCAADSTSCRAHFQCLGACGIGDWQCRAQCRLDHPDGTTDQYAPLTACVARNCEKECGLTCGGLDYFAPPSAAARCQSCLSTASNDVCSAERACASSVDCVTYGQCFRGCSTPDCRGACALASDAGPAMPLACRFATPVYTTSSGSPTRRRSTRRAPATPRVPWARTGPAWVPSFGLPQGGVRSLTGARVTSCSQFGAFSLGPRSLFSRTGDRGADHGDGAQCSND